MYRLEVAKKVITVVTDDTVTSNYTSIVTDYDKFEGEKSVFHLDIFLTWLFTMTILEFTDFLRQRFKILFSSIRILGIRI